MQTDPYRAEHGSAVQPDERRLSFRRNRRSREYQLQMQEFSAVLRACPALESDFCKPFPEHACEIEEVSLNAVAFRTGHGDRIAKHPCLELQIGHRELQQPITVLVQPLRCDRFDIEGPDCIWRSHLLPDSRHEWSKYLEFVKVHIAMVERDAGAPDDCSLSRVHMLLTGLEIHELQAAIANHPILAVLVGNILHDSSLGNDMARDMLRSLLGACLPGNRFKFRAVEDALQSTSARWAKSGYCLSGDQVPQQLVVLKTTNAIITHNRADEELHPDTFLESLHLLAGRIRKEPLKRRRFTRLLKGSIGGRSDVLWSTAAGNEELKAAIEKGCTTDELEIFLLRMGVPPDQINPKGGVVGFLLAPPERIHLPGAADGAGFIYFKSPGNGSRIATTRDLHYGHEPFTEVVLEPAQLWRIRGIRVWNPVS